jgi:squalene-hopene/tetraprenyl-beta-curcumene cyclase
MKRTGLLGAAIAACFALLGVAAPARAGEPAPKAKDWRASAELAIDKGLSALRSKDGNGDGVWEFGGVKMAGVTSMCLLAHFQSPIRFTEQSHGSLWSGLKWLSGMQQPTGAIFQKEEGNANYVTSVSLLAFVLSGDAHFQPYVERGRDYLVTCQVTEGVYAGGFGYEDRKSAGKAPYADIVNTEFALEALRQAGLPPDHEAWKRAITFLQNCQHDSEHNKAAWVTDIGEYRGGFVYHPDASKAETAKVEEGGKEKTILLPYGSVTYAGIKSMIYAHLAKDDPRVVAAVDWIRRHWTLDENPGFDVKRDPNLGKQGYFYYFTTFAKALQALGVETLKDAKGVEHPWREELVARIVALQDPKTGTWKNTWHDRWFESLEELSTSYAVIALSFALMEKL